MPNNMLYLGINLLMLDMPRYRLYWRGGRTENSKVKMGEILSFSLF